MKFFSALFGKAKEPEPLQQAVIVHFDYGSTDFEPVYALEAKLDEQLRASGVGEFDGDELAVDGHDGFLYMYGDDADKLFAAVRPLLESADFMRGARVALMYADDDDSREVVLAG